MSKWHLKSAKCNITISNKKVQVCMCMYSNYIIVIFCRDDMKTIFPVKFDCPIEKNVQCILGKELLFTFCCFIFLITTL